ncbi:MAG: hypothetical protein EZS28_028189, partial [Streblomastix strix]
MRAYRKNQRLQAQDTNKILTPEFFSSIRIMGMDIAFFKQLLFLFIINVNTKYLIIYPIRTKEIQSLIPALEQL